MHGRTHQLFTLKRRPQFHEKFPLELRTRTTQSTLKLFRNYFIRKPPRKLMLFSQKKGLCCVRFLYNLFQTFLTRLQSPILSIILQYFIVKPLCTYQPKKLEAKIQSNVTHLSQTINFAVGIYTLSNSSDCNFHYIFFLFFSAGILAPCHVKRPQISSWQKKKVESFWFETVPQSRVITYCV